jgi:hypothetical protein
MMLGIIGGSLCCCCGGGGVGLYMKKKGSSLTVAPGDSDPDKAGKRAGIIARANERFAAKQSVQDKAKAAKNEKVEAIKDKAKAWTVETLDVTYDNTQEGDRATWPDIIGACNEANPDNKLAKGDRIIGVEADEASVVESKIVLEVQEDLSVTPGKANEAEDKAVLEKLQEKKSFQIKVERDKATPAEASEEANGEAAPDAETDEEAKARLADGKAATKVGGGFLSGLKAKGAKKLQDAKDKKTEKAKSKKEKKDAKAAAKEAATGEGSKEGEEAAKDDDKSKEEAKPADDVKPAEESAAETEETKPSDGEVA